MRSSSLVVVFLVGCVSSSKVGEPEVDVDERIETPVKTEVESLPCTGEDDAAAAVRRSISRVRAAAGLPELRCDDAISKAAAAHCAYVAANGVLTHVEERGKPKFVGERFGDRMSAMGAHQAPASEVLANIVGDAAVDGADGWLNSVYHRAPLLRSEVIAFGYGHADGCSTVDLARSPTTTERWVVWPPNGSRSVPTAFSAEHESPNPVPGRALVGSPISFVSNLALKAASASLSGPDGAVPAVLITESTDAAGLVRAGEIHLVPTAPLAPLTTYTATFSIRGAEPLRVTTTFTTGHSR